MSSSSAAAAEWKQVNSVFAQEGVPTAVWQSIAGAEGYNPNAVGDNNTSFGLFQDHIGGQLPTSWAASAQAGTGPAFNPVANAEISSPAIAKAYKLGKSLGYSGVELAMFTASHSGHPATLRPSQFEDAQTQTEASNVAALYIEYGSKMRPFPNAGGGVNTGSGLTSLLGNAWNQFLSTAGLGSNNGVSPGAVSGGVTSSSALANPNGTPNYLPSQNGWDGFLQDLHHAETFEAKSWNLLGLSVHDAETSFIRIGAVMIGLLIFVMGLYSLIGMEPLGPIGGSAGSAATDIPPVV